MNVSPFLLSAEYMHLQRVKDKISGENVWLVSPNRPISKKLGLKTILLIPTPERGVPWGYWLVRYLSRDDSNNDWDNSRYVVNWKTNVNCHLGVNIGKYFRIEIHKMM